MPGKQGPRARRETLAARQGGTRVGPPPQTDPARMSEETGQGRRVHDGQEATRRRSSRSCAASLPLPRRLDPSSLDRPLTTVGLDESAGRGSGLRSAIPTTTDRARASLHLLNPSWSIASVSVHRPEVGGPHVFTCRSATKSGCVQTRAHHCARDHLRLPERLVAHRLSLFSAAPLRISRIRDCRAIKVNRWKASKQEPGPHFTHSFPGDPSGRCSFALPRTRRERLTKPSSLSMRIRMTTSSPRSLRKRTSSKMASKMRALTKATLAEQSRIINKRMRDVRKRAASSWR